MPINIPDGLPAKKTLQERAYFLRLRKKFAEHQEIRPLRLAILNLMPKKIQTETQILRLISKSPIQVTCDFMRISSHESKNTAADHLVTFYSTFDDFKDKNYDGLIITGAPIEDLKYEDVDYWDEFCRIVDWSQEHVFSTMYLCWGALAGLYYLHDILLRRCWVLSSLVFSHSVYAMSIASSPMDLTRYITCHILVMLRLRHQLWWIILNLRCFLRDLPAVPHFSPQETFTKFL